MSTILVNIWPSVYLNFCDMSGWMFLLVPAHLGCPRQSSESRIFYFASVDPIKIIECWTYIVCALDNSRPSMSMSEIVEFMRLRNVDPAEEAAAACDERNSNTDTCDTESCDEDAKQVSKHRWCESVYFVTFKVLIFLTLLWRCWLGSRKSTRPIKNWLMGCGCGHLSIARCKWVDMLQLMPLSPHHLLLNCNPEWFCLPGTGLPGLSWKRGHSVDVVFGRPYYRSSLWYSMSSVCRRLSVCLWRFVLWQNGAS